MYTITITKSGLGDEHVLGTVESLEKGLELVHATDERFEKWQEDGYPELPENDILNHWEGCDVYAASDEGEGFALRFLDDNDEWSEL